MASVTFPPAVGGDGSTVTDDSNVTTGLGNGGHRTRFVPALAQVVAVANNTVTKATEASSSASTAAGHATTASNWATKTDNFVSGSDNSAKSWAVGGSGSGDPAAGSSKDWATKTSGTVDGSEYSAKYYAQQSSAAASASGARWNFDSSTTMADPGTGEIRLNNATFSSVTQIAVSALSADSGNPDISDYILTWDDSTSTVKGVLSIRELGTPDSIVVFKVSGTITDNGVWLQIPVTYVMNSGSVTNGNQLVVQFSASGDAGAGDVTLNGVQTLTNKTLVDSTTTISDNVDGTKKVQFQVSSVATGTTRTLTVPNEDMTLAGRGANTFTSNQTGSDNLLIQWMMKDVGSVYLDKGTVSSGTVTFNYTDGSHQRLQVGGALTIAANAWPPSGNNGILLIELVNGASATITWPTVNWIKSDGTTTTTFSSNGITLQTSGTDWVILWTRDAGTTVYGKIVR